MWCRQEVPPLARRSRVSAFRMINVSLSLSREPGLPSPLRHRYTRLSDAMAWRIAEQRMNSLGSRHEHGGGIVNVIPLGLASAGGGRCRWGSVEGVMADRRGECGGEAKGDLLQLLDVGVL